MEPITISVRCYDEEENNARDECLGDRWVPDPRGDSQKRLLDLTR